eukprot:167927-Prymnesium_polylepis.1
MANHRPMIMRLTLFVGGHTGSGTMADAKSSGAAAAAAIRGAASSRGLATCSGTAANAVVAVGRTISTSGSSRIADGEPLEAGCASSLSAGAQSCDLRLLLLVGARS